jgi:hypothetical protein
VSTLYSVVGGPLACDVVVRDEFDMKQHLSIQFFFFSKGINGNYITSKKNSDNSEPANK